MNPAVTQLMESSSRVRSRAVISKLVLPCCCHYFYRLTYQSHLDCACNSCVTARARDYAGNGAATRNSKPGAAIRGRDRKQSTREFMNSWALPRSALLRRGEALITALIQFL